MSIIEMSIDVAASPARVWEVLGTLDALERYDPGVARSRIVSETRTGIGASRRCDLAPGGWFRERVTSWEPERALGFELVECTLPVRRLRHDYVLTAIGAGTRVDQRMDYQLKLGVLGRLLDAVVVRRKWRAGIDGFLHGLKRQVEGRATVGS